MALNIRNSEAEKLAAELAAMTGVSKTEAVTKALRERLAHVTKSLATKRRIASRLDEIAKHCAALPVLDTRSPDNMLYDENGLPR